MATNENRIALQGGLDFVKGRFDDVTVTLIDAKGCAKVRQKISGPLPETGGGEAEHPGVSCRAGAQVAQEGKEALPRRGVRSGLRRFGGATEMNGLQLNRRNAQGIYGHGSHDPGVIQENIAFIDKSQTMPPGR